MPLQAATRVFFLDGLKHYLGATLNTLLLRLCADHSCTVLEQKNFEQRMDTDLIFGTEQALFDLMTQTQFVPTDRFILFLTEKTSTESTAESFTETMGDQLKKIRFVLSKQTESLFHLLISHILDYFQNKKETCIKSQLQNTEALILRMELVESSERGEVQQKALDFFDNYIRRRSGGAVGTGSYPKNLVFAMEEFLMNAIWDANPKYNHVDRSKPLKLGLTESVSVECVCCEEKMYVSVSDQFGTFSAAAMDKCISEYLVHRGRPMVDEVAPGAGIGLSLVVHKIGLLVFEVKKGKITSVTAVVRSNEPLRDMQKKPRNILFFTS